MRPLNEAQGVLMKDWVMIHKIKALYDHGTGSSIRAIAEHLQLSRNTVRKYLRRDETAISARLGQTERAKVLDEYREYLGYLLRRYPRLSGPKALRKLREKAPGVEVSERSLRRYLRQLKQTHASAQRRYYEPVIDIVPGVQCQVDGGELRQVLIGGVEQVVYFVVFVLSYSRLLYVSASARPIDTVMLIRMHDAAFRYFGGVVQECVYDQAKLVVINEEFRELTLNQRFAEYATHAGFAVRACAGYDPESKGKVEAGVKYVKYNGLYAEEFPDWEALHVHLAHWLERQANARCHAATGEVPRAHFERAERAVLTPYLSPTLLLDPATRVTRKADKTGLIAWQGNKYSVPLNYQQSSVGVDCEDGQLRVHDLASGECIATHRLCPATGQIIKNTNHYRDYRQRIRDLEAAVAQRLGEVLGAKLCQQLKASEPKIYKDQLAGVLKLLQQYPEVPVECLASLAERPHLTATQLRDYLAAYSRCPERLHPEPSQPHAAPTLLAVYHALNQPQPGRNRP